MENTDVFTGRPLNPGQNQDTLNILLRQARSGSQEAFAELYSLYFKKIYKFIFYRVSHKEVAEDLTEEVFIKAHQKISATREDNSFEGWLYQIARNKVIDYYRSKKITVALEDVENILEYESNILNDLHLQDQQKVFLHLLKSLRQEQQMVIKLKFLENLDNAEIAVIMKKNEGAIRVIQHRAIARLQELIKKLGH